MAQVVDQATAECAAIIKRLAEREIKCQAVLVTGEHSSSCYHCGGTGKVAEFPWLRRECPGFGGFSHESATLQVAGCPNCQGQGWVLRLDIPIEEALAAMPRVMRRTVLCRFYLSKVAFQAGTLEQIRLAFWQAVEKVIGNA